MKFIVKYESSPVSEVVKTCEVEVFDAETLDYDEAAQAVNSVNKLLNRPLITGENIIHVERKI